MNGTAHEKIDWNVTPITARKTARPHTLCVTTASSRAVQSVRPVSATDGCGSVCRTLRTMSAIAA